MGTGYVVEPDRSSYSGPVRIVPGSAPGPLSMLPSGPDVRLERGGAAGHPAVVVRNTGTDPVGGLTITVKLPTDTDLVWGPTGNPPRPDHRLTVLPADPTRPPIVHSGRLSDDGRSLTFTEIDALHPGSESQVTMYVAVGAGAGAPLAYTSLTFFAESHTSASSNPIQVT
ncbi:hypothetical protein [Embleya sp. NPDC020630]|uniref:hypothetical protein n=1 Tax=Embleya sp. NPDC020630 TaxID=3363979 RepID=UPI0037A12B8C